MLTMYTTKEKGKTVNWEKFKNMSELVETMENRGVNAVFRNEELSSMKDETNKKSKFSGVNTYEEMEQIIERGYSEPLKKLKQGILKIDQNEKEYKKPRPKNDFIGFVPNVPNTLMNLPQTMINRERLPQKNKNIHLTYSFCADGSVKTENFIKAGIKFVGLVNSLEKQGYRVKIDTVFFSVSNKEITGFIVTMKEFSQNLNLLKLAFPLIHPSMLRRISFRYLETMPAMKDTNYTNGYGYPLTFHFGNNGNKEKQWLFDNGILKSENSYYCNVYQAMDCKNIEELAKIMEISR